MIVAALLGFQKTRHRLFGSGLQALSVSTATLALTWSAYWLVMHVQTLKTALSVLPQFSTFPYWSQLALGTVFAMPSLLIFSLGAIFERTRGLSHIGMMASCLVMVADALNKASVPGLDKWMEDHYMVSVFESLFAERLPAFVVAGLCGVWLVKARFPASLLEYTYRFKPRISSGFS